MYGGPADTHLGNSTPLDWDGVGGRPIHTATSPADGPWDDVDAMRGVATVAVEAKTPTLVKPCETCWAVGRVGHTHSRACLVVDSHVDYATGKHHCPIPVDSLCPTCKGKRTVLRKVALAYDDATGNVIVQVEGGGRYRLGPHIHSVTPLPRCPIDAPLVHCPGCIDRDRTVSPRHCEHCYLA